MYVGLTASGRAGGFLGIPVPGLFRRRRPKGYQSGRCLVLRTLEPPGSKYPSVAPHLAVYGTRCLFLCKSAIGSESSWAFLMRCDAIVKATSPGDTEERKDGIEAGKVRRPLLIALALCEREKANNCRPRAAKAGLWGGEMLTCNHVARLPNTKWREPAASRHTTRTRARCVIVALTAHACAATAAPPPAAGGEATTSLLLRQGPATTPHHSRPTNEPPQKTKPGAKGPRWTRPLPLLQPPLTPHSDLTAGERRLARGWRSAPLIGRLCGRSLPSCPGARNVSMFGTAEQLAAGIVPMPAHICMNGLYYSYNKVEGAAVAEWLNCWPFKKANRVQSSAEYSPGIFARGNRAGQCRWSAGFLGVLPFPAPLHSGAALYSPQFTLIDSQDLVVKRRPKLATQFSAIESIIGSNNTILSELSYSVEGRKRPAVLAQTRPQQAVPLQVNDTLSTINMIAALPMREMEVSMKQRRSARADETGDHRENPPTSFWGRFPLSEVVSGLNSICIFVMWSDGSRSEATRGPVRGYRASKTGLCRPGHGLSLPRVPLLSRAYRNCRAGLVPQSSPALGTYTRFYLLAYFQTTFVDDGCCSRIEISNHQFRRFEWNFISIASPALNSNGATVFCSILDPISDQVSNHDGATGHKSIEWSVHRTWMCRD
ncbi:hypothetical protein PR048_033695 [Dryococelus australis]|uniref:Uncharacterized protein n=1 Tax=Dryococelus australis TaxID=614101 RepID=A0ABQ9G3V3_9NEOP|nr:hypothetical protein PR048_033695 [Dryococelus australis]